MTLNPNKTKALVVCWSKTVNPPHGDLVLFWVSIYASPNSNVNVIFSFSCDRCIRRPSFALIRLSWCCVIDVMLLHCVRCTRFIQTRIIVCSVSYHLLLSEFDIPSALAAAHPLELEVLCCRTSQFARCFLPAQTRVWNVLLTLRLTLER